jgi:hypothetical protein
MADNLINEQWTPLNDYDNYAVSNCGRVKNITTNKILKATDNARGYLHLDLCKNGKPKKHKVHRLVAQYFLLNADEKLFVDHIDGNTLNNHVSNLRFATKQENNRNRTMSSKNTTGFKGVCYNKSKKRYQANITINGKLKHLGYYKTAEEASESYQETAQRLFGEFARV